VSILLSEDFTFIVQGITGREAVNLTKECLDYGAKVVGGVTPGKGGTTHIGLPVFNTTKEAVDSVCVTADMAAPTQGPLLAKTARRGISHALRTTCRKLPYASASRHWLSHNLSPQIQSAGAL